MNFGKTIHLLRDILFSGNLKNHQIFICGQLWSVNFDIQLLKRIFAPIFK